VAPYLPWQEISRVYQQRNSLHLLTTDFRLVVYLTALTGRCRYAVSKACDETSKTTAYIVGLLSANIADTWMGKSIELFCLSYIPLVSL
jgi:hypothetical protein